MVWVDATRNPVGVVIRTGKPYICQNTQADPNYARRRAEALKLGYLSLISLPLIASGLTFGALNIHADEPDAFDLEETKLLTELADDLAYGIMALRMRVEHKRGEARLQQSFTQLRKTLEDTVNSLASAVGQRDPYTAGHQQRVTKLALAIGVEMALPQEQVDGIRIAGLLHDIGKIGVPAEILSKPTKLTDAEFLIVKGHTTVGYDILKGIDFPWPIARIVGQHHERLNGSGYPYGLKGPDILLEAKILAVADVVEAMSSHRPYRPARGIEAALDEINKNRGLLYDAAVVEACLRLFTEKAFKFESPA
jgi:putative nucleotidyltransferase with HDIG domain